MYLLSKCLFKLYYYLLNYIFLSSNSKINVALFNKYKIFHLKNKL